MAMSKSSFRSELVTTIGLEWHEGEPPWNTAGRILVLMQNGYRLVVSSNDIQDDYTLARDIAYWAILPLDEFVAPRLRPPNGRYWVKRRHASQVWEWIAATVFDGEVFLSNDTNTRWPWTDWHIGQRLAEPEIDERYEPR